MTESWDDYADGWDSNKDVRSYAEKAFKSLCSIVDLNGLRVLDFGCGTGLLTAKMEPFADRIVALDNSEKMISILKNKKINNVETLAISLTKKSIKSNTALHTKFDLITASSVCAFLSDYEDTVGLLKMLLKPQGLFVQWDWLKTENDPDFGLSKADIEKAFIKSGLQIKSITEPFSLESEQGSMSVLMGVGISA